MPGKNVFRLWLMDQTRKNHFNRWDDAARKTVGETLKGYFEKVCLHPLCKFGTVEFTWQGIGFRRADHGYAHTDIVLHFLDDRRSSILRSRFNIDLPHGTGHSGATFLTTEGMLSEIHVWENENGTDARFPKLIANLAFHEAMHNKLDADPKQTKREVHEIFKTAVGGLSEPTISSRSDLKPQEINAMAPALSRSIPQF